MKKLTIDEHLKELRIRIFKIIIFFLLIFFVSYFCAESIYNFLTKPLYIAQNKMNKDVNVQFIYTALPEVFFTYIKLSVFVGFIFTIPYILWQIYYFILPGLLKYEKAILSIILIFSLILLYIALYFVLFIVLPKAWLFFVSFSMNDSIVPLILQPKISEYINMIITIITGFCIAFQMPVIILILRLLKMIDTKILIKYRRLAIIINFVLGAILTPPDIISQIALAIPLIFLYELTIILCKYVPNLIDNIHSKNK